MNNSRITGVQLQGFLDICKENDEILIGSKYEIRRQLRKCLKTQGYWAGVRKRYFLDEEGWRAENRVLGVLIII